MSCNSIKNRFEQMKANGGLKFNDAVTLYSELLGSIDAHRIELEELRQTGDQAKINDLTNHISSGENMLTQIKNMIVQ